MPVISENKHNSSSLDNYNEMALIKSRVFTYSRCLHHDYDKWVYFVSTIIIGKWRKPPWLAIPDRMSAVLLPRIQPGKIGSGDLGLECT